MSQKPLTKREQGQIVRLYTAGGSSKVIGGQLGVPNTAVYKFLVGAGIMRTRKEAKQLERERGQKRKHAERSCMACNEGYLPTSSNQKHCKGCVPDTHALRMLKTLGLSRKDWKRMFDEQDGICALCPSPAKVVDHCHVTMIVRGLLCTPCNMALNRMEQPGWNLRAMRYLDEAKP